MGGGETEPAHGFLRVLRSELAALKDLAVDILGTFVAFRCSQTNPFDGRYAVNGRAHPDAVGEAEVKHRLDVAAGGFGGDFSE